MSNYILIRRHLKLIIGVNSPDKFLYSIKWSIQFSRSVTVKDMNYKSEMPKMLKFEYLEMERKYGTLIQRFIGIEKYDFQNSNKV